MFQGLAGRLPRRLAGWLTSRIDRIEELRIERRKRDQRFGHLHARAADLLCGVPTSSLVIAKRFDLLQRHG